MRLKNFRAFRNVELKNIPPYCVFVGANGSGKTTLFSVFNFLKTAMQQNVTSALGELGGGRGLREIRTRGESGDIEIEIKFRPSGIGKRVSYSLVISEKNGRPIVKRERLRYRRSSYGQPWGFLDFTEGSGWAVTDTHNLQQEGITETDLNRENQTLKSSDILAIKALAQFEKFPAVVALGKLIENWQVFDFHIQAAKADQQTGGHAEVLDKNGGNLALVTDFLYHNHRDVFDKIRHNLPSRIPGISGVEAKTMDDGRVLLRFRDDSFESPILARHISDGTMRMLAYLVLLHHPKPHPLLGVEEPENQLHPFLLAELAEEFRQYANKGGQVFVSTHSPDFLNAARLDEVFWLDKQKGFTDIHPAASNEQVKAYMEDGDKMGRLWQEGLFAPFTLE